MVSESVMRNGPLSSHLNGSNSHNHNVMTNTVASSDNVISSTTRLCLSPSSSCSPFRRVCGVVLASDRQPGCRNNTCDKNCMSKCSRSSIVLGSIILEKEVLTVDELRIILLSQVNTIPKNFTFLSKEGWPILPAQETRLSSSNIVTDQNSLSIKQVFDRPRIGVVTTDDALGFVFADLSSSVDSIREMVDDLLQQIAANNRISRIPDFKFVDKHGWPVLKSQEECLTVLDLMISQNIRIQFRSNILKYVSDGLANDQIAPFPMQIANCTNSGSNVGQLIDSPDARFALPSAADTQITLRDEIENYREDSIRRKGSKKGSAITRWGSTRRRTMELKKIKSKEPSHLIMISYARQEAADHALRLKDELTKLGISVYLDVHEITTGTDWQDSLNNAVSKCPVFVPLVTELYGKTQWTNREVKLADILHKQIIPINFMESWPPECLAIQFATTQYIGWLPEDTDVDKGQLDGIKVWPRPCIKKIAKALAKQLPKQQREVRFAEIPRDRRLEGPQVVISAHPKDLTVAIQIKSSLESEGYNVWCSSDVAGSGCWEDPGPQTLPSSVAGTPTCLPTITEGQSLESADSMPFPDAYKEMARNLVASKHVTRPTSLPPLSHNASPGFKSLTGDAGTKAHSLIEVARKPLTRMISQLSDVCPSMSLTPEKKDKFTRFSAKVRSCSVVIILSSDHYFQSATSMKHVFYCEIRKPLIVIKTESMIPPSWFSNLTSVQLEVSVKKSRYMDVIKSHVRRIMDPSSAQTATTEEMHEAKVQYCARMMSKNIEYLATCVYVVGSTKLSDERSVQICRSLGIALAQVKNLTLVTSGRKGAQDLVAKSFLSALESSEEISGMDADKKRTAISSRIVHVLPLKDEKDVTESCSQNEDGHFEPMSYGKTLFLGESNQEREAVLARLMDTCILIEGDATTAREVEDFIWNDHFVIPVISTGGAAGGRECGVDVSFKVFERPNAVDEKVWQILANREATPTEVSKAVVRIVMDIKEHIAELLLSQQEAKEAKTLKQFKTRLRRSSKKKPSDKLDVGLAAEAGGDLETSSPEKILPIVEDADRGEEKPSPSKWKRVQKIITFTKNC